MSACPNWVPSGLYPSLVPLGRDVSAFIIAPTQVTRVLVEDIWERDGFGRLWVVAKADAERVAAILKTVAVCHRPALLRPQSDSEARRAVIDTLTRLRRGDVFIVAEENTGRARSWIAEGTSWLAAWAAPKRASLSRAEP
jgi:hypothetical protein